jgi:hypothetical protein
MTRSRLERIQRKNRNIQRTPPNRFLEKAFIHEIKRAITPSWSNGLHFVVAFGDTDPGVTYHLPTSRLFLSPVPIRGVTPPA